MVATQTKDDVCKFVPDQLASSLNNLNLKESSHSHSHSHDHGAASHSHSPSESYTPLEHGHTHEHLEHAGERVVSMSGRPPPIDQRYVVSGPLRLQSY